MTSPPILDTVEHKVAYKISADDTVSLMVLSGPATSGSSTTVCFEVWEPGGSQPDNSHPDSSETFVVLRGEGMAHSDDHVAPLYPGTVIVLPVGSVHRIINTSETENLYTITVMEKDSGFEDMILRGVPTALSATDLAVLSGAGAPGSAAR